nr:MAG TPA: hypothetical protein [Caudoviricetes sp.]
MNDKERINATLGKLALYACAGAFTCEQDDVVLFIKHFLQLEDQAESAAAWNARYNALLEEVEEFRIRRYDADCDKLPAGSVVLDCDGDAWQREESGWVCINGVFVKPLDEEWAPYTVIYTPKEES